jgi:hypothetical protein
MADDNILRFPHFERIDLNEIAKLAERVGLRYRYYALVNRSPMPIDDPISWAHEMVKRGMCKQTTGVDPWRVDETVIGDARVSTVSIGLDHRFVGEGPPIVFETMLFGGKHDQYQDRCATWDEAEAAHQRVVAMVRQLRVVK